MLSHLVDAGLDRQVIHTKDAWKSDQMAESVCRMLILLAQHALRQPQGCNTPWIAPLVVAGVVGKWKQIRKCAKTLSQVRHDADHILDFWDVLTSSTGASAGLATPRDATKAPEQCAGLAAMQCALFS
jgi:hypothetical protein